MDTPLWSPPPSRRTASQLWRFMAALNEARSLTLESYAGVHRFSLEHPQAFWAALWDFAGVKAAMRGETVLAPGASMKDTRFFPDARLNYAENLLQGSGDRPALIFRGEDRVRRTVSFDELKAQVSQLQQAFLAHGIKPGERICAVLPNMPESIAAFLAAASIGAIWSSCSPDFGARGILDRFGQIAPRLLITCDGYYYAGKTHLLQAKIAEVQREIPSLERTVVVNYTGNAGEMAASLDRAETLEAFTRDHAPAPLQFAQLPFDHPLYILFSSGTTGVPKCIVHRAGGILLKHLSEHLLNTDTRATDRLFYFSTCGWMMWNWLVSGLAAKATLMLFDGSPFHPSERVLFDYADEEAITIFGTSAKYIDAVKKTGWQPKETHKLSALRTMMSTGSPLAAEGFDFVYDAIKADLHLASISGGTDICGCFAGGNPLSAVYRGEIQGAMLGTAADVYGDDGQPLAAGKGELVCTQAFPSMPLGFWNDPDGQKYHNAYYARFPGIWHHGDFAEWTGHGGMIIHGRSDATLNPGGVRIGTAELYAQVERVPEVIEALAIGQDWDGDVRVVLFVRLRAGAILDEALEKRIKAQIREGATPRHVPARIIAVADIPRTKSGKIVELAVRDIVHGRAVNNQEALANPEALELFKSLPALAH